MIMFDPPHPGEFINEVYLEPYSISMRAAATNLGVSPSTFARLIKQQSGISPEMALRLSKVFGRTPESWLTMQDQYDLWQVKQKVNLGDVKPMNFAKRAAV